ncbi:phage baseplate protein [Anaerosolibacter sp.]|uniref:phage baseplate protein n=1 Tax=Anaerosolibacter sp. TaxID=1872527 RepID=UPI0039EE27D3
MAKAIVTDGNITVEFTIVKSEKPHRSSEVTSNPVETGEDVSDHVRSNPIEFPITGMIAGANAAQKLNQLEQFRKNGTRLRYVGRNYIDNVVIESFVSTHDATIKNGFQFDITLKQVRIAVKKTVDIVVSSQVSPTQVKPVENKGRQQIKKKPTDPQTMDRMIASARAKVNSTMA